MRKPYRKVTLSSLFISGIIGLGMLGFIWYLISPLFIDEPVDEALPTSAAQTGAQANPLGIIAADATAAMQLAMTEEPKRMDDPMPLGDSFSMTILARGLFYPVAHPGQGTATLYQLPDGSRLLRFENFEVLNGPGLHVYLTSLATVVDSVGVDLPNFVDLGALKGTLGSQNYPIPANLDLDLYRSVVIWCVPFRVPFSAAALAAP
ncbi:MAG: DM13 domain-containing protein [Anaerolineae bacterium]|nr:DM13 domain-containing protein [Anaerolineae bacterium]